MSAVIHDTEQVITTYVSTHGYGYMYICIYRWLRMNIKKYCISCIHVRTYMKLLAFIETRAIISPDTRAFIILDATDDENS